ncbi:hypothetical protein L917_20974 [Phytophthora nicotianae]|uniref:Uncharacterized protein n=1 Tax=Phytophthora nicotianae TaxID=4792 RepID=W2JZ79_PHYNI|nr:hypothetical protein L917_20974 [Phytophthora nicotianae]
MPSFTARIHAPPPWMARNPDPTRRTVCSTTAHFQRQHRRPDREIHVLGLFICLTTPFRSPQCMSSERFDQFYGWLSAASGVCEQLKQDKSPVCLRITAAQAAISIPSLDCPCVIAQLGFTAC